MKHDWAVLYDGSQRVCCNCWQTQILSGVHWRTTIRRSSTRHRLQRTSWFIYKAFGTPDGTPMDADSGYPRMPRSKSEAEVRLEFWPQADDKQD